GVKGRAAMILRIRQAQVCGPHSLCLDFNDGTTKRVNLLPLLEGPVFEPLRAPADFARVTLDPVCGTVCWPNGADFAPEALLELQAEEGFDPATEGQPTATPGRARRERSGAGPTAP